MTAKEQVLKAIKQQLQDADPKYDGTSLNLDSSAKSDEKVEK